MKERPILFSAPMVRALLDSSKTQTRRVFKAINGGVWPNQNDLPGMRQILRSCPYGQPGDRLWVREAWATHASFDRYAPSELTHIRSFHYWADGDAVTGKKRPSIHMPRWASRITLEITGVRLERLQEISEGDALAEGVKPLQDAGAVFAPAKSAYCDLWESINGLGTWFSNPWVWVVEFKRITA